jgi:hypothetical protein
MKYFYWNPVDNPERVRAVYSTLYAQGKCVYELRQNGCLWSSGAGAYAGLDGDAEHTLLQLGNNPLIVCSVNDGLISKVRACEWLHERGMKPDDLVSAGVQKVRRDLQDMVRRTINEFVAQYFESGPQDRRAQGF